MMRQINFRAARSVVLSSMRGASIGDTLSPERQDQDFFRFTLSSGRFESASSGDLSPQKTR